jgi:hypothetical protein
MESSRNTCVPIPSVSLPEADPERDANLERDLILTLSKLDHYRARLADRQVAHKPTLALQILLNMLDEVTAFTEHVLQVLNDDQRGREELTQAGELYNSIQATLKDFMPSAVQSVFSFFGGESGNKDRRRQDLHELAGRFLEILKGFFELFQGVFSISWSSTEWIQAYQIFLVDLEPVVGSLTC